MGRVQLSSEPPLVAVRQAHLRDVVAVRKLVAPYVATGDLLPRSERDLCRHIREYVVAEGGAGNLIGCGAPRIQSSELAEVAALAVREDQQGAGIGRMIVARLVARALTLGVREVFAVSRTPAFFFRLGFRTAQREQFPSKLQADCATCPRRECCDLATVVLPLAQRAGLCIHEPHDHGGGAPPASGAR